MTYGDWDDVNEHGVERVACVERPDTPYSACIADPNAWRTDGTVVTFATIIAETCGQNYADMHAKARKQAREAATQVLDLVAGNIERAKKLLETKRRDQWFRDTAERSTPYFVAHQLIAEHGRIRSDGNQRGTVGAFLAEMRERGIVFDSDIPLEDE